MVRHPRVKLIVINCSQLAISLLNYRVDETKNISTLIGELPIPVQHQF